MVQRRFQNFPRPRISNEEWERRQREKFQQEWAKDTANKKRKQVEDALIESGLQEAVKTKTFDSFVATEPWQKKAKHECMEYAADPKGWLLLSGQSGAGKTHLCTAIVGKLIEKDIPVWYMMYRDAIDVLKGLEGSKEDREKLMNKYKKVRYLYIDDLFKGGISEADKRVMFALLNHRYTAHLSTIISTELSVEELVDIDEATGGRIIEEARMVIIQSDSGKNYRLK